MARDFREILGGEVAGADELDEVSKEDLEKHPMKPVGLSRPKMKKGNLYTWDQINTAMTMIGFGPRVIVKLLSAINRVVKERLTVKQESTSAGAVGNYSPPLGMSRRDSQKFSTTTAMKQQFAQCTFHMDRKGMLQQCRKLGLSLGHLKDDDLRKTLADMSVRNKRKFMGIK